MKNSIFETLCQLGLTSSETRRVFSKHTRDVADLTVWKDVVSGVIYVDDYYVGDEVYESGAYRADARTALKLQGQDYEAFMDAERRFNLYSRYVCGKRILDFGCGAGDFLRLADSHASDVNGVELQRDYLEQLNADGIHCTDHLNDIEDSSIQTCFAFHVLEHLPDPLEILRQLKSKLTQDGLIIVEVPHANDFLLSDQGSKPFKDFTLWSQHLVLHTRESLNRMLSHAGFFGVMIEGVQRYSIANHMNWLASGTPGGHRSSLAMIETPELCKAYEASLARLDVTDTLVAIARAA